MAALEQNFVNVLTWKQVHANFKLIETNFTCVCFSDERKIAEQSSFWIQEGEGTFPCHVEQGANNALCSALGCWEQPLAWKSCNGFGGRPNKSYSMRHFPNNNH